MQACKHLDHEEGKFTNCELVQIGGFSVPVKHWKREKVWTDNGPGQDPNPANVQFCKLRGRIKGIFQCYNPGEMGCYEVKDPATDPDMPAVELS